MLTDTCKSCRLTFPVMVQRDGTYRCPGCNRMFGESEQEIALRELGAVIWKEIVRVIEPLAAWLERRLKGT